MDDLQSDRELFEAGVAVGQVTTMREIVEAILNVAEPRDREVRALLRANRRMKELFRAVKSERGGAT